MLSPRTIAIYWTVGVFVFGSILVFGFVAANHKHAREWDRQLAEVTWSGTLCDISYRPFLSKKLRYIKTVECSDVGAEMSRLMVSHPDITSREVKYVRIRYPSLGREETTLESWRLSSVALHSGEKVPILVYPKNVRRIETPPDPSDILKASFFLVIATASTFCFVFFREEARRSRNA